MSQTDIMLESEGDAWLERNRAKLGQHDPVSEVIADLRLQPKRVLEIGCANGWRLARLRAQYGCEVFGVDPSAKAVAEAGGLNSVPAARGTADSLPLGREMFDLVICGFCLYLTDPADWLRIAAEVNRVLTFYTGVLVIHDFAVKGESFARFYKHNAGVTAYHFDFAKLWLAHPWYMLMERRIIGDECVTALRKGHLIEERP